MTPRRIALFAVATAVLAPPFAGALRRTKFRAPGKVIRAANVKVVS